MFILFTKLYPNYPEVKFIYTYPPNLFESGYDRQEITDVVSCFINTDAKSTEAIITRRLH